MNQTVAVLDRWTGREQATLCLVLSMATPTRTAAYLIASLRTVLSPRKDITLAYTFYKAP